MAVLGVRCRGVFLPGKVEHIDLSMPVGHSLQGSVGKMMIFFFRVRSESDLLRQLPAFLAGGFKHVLFSPRSLGK